MPGPKSKTAEALVVGLLCLGALCLFYYEVIFENRTFLPFGSPGEVMGGAPPWGFAGTIRTNPYRLDAGGSAWQLEPWARTVAASYANFQLPLWNPHQFFGTPLAADAQPGAFDILRLPALVTVHAWGWDVYYLSQSALSLVLTYVFARSVGFRPQAAFVAAIGYSFSGFMFIRGNMHYIEVYHLLPGILWGTQRIVRGAYRSGILIVAACVAMTLFAGMPEATLLTFLYAASYGAFRVTWGAAVLRSWRFALDRNLVLALAWIGGIGVAAPLLIPQFEYLGLSFNIHPPERGLGLWTLPPRALAFIGVPFINGLPTQGITTFGLTPLDDYSGAAVVLLALVGTMSLGQLGEPMPAAVFALASAIVWGAKLFGVPGIQALGQLPLLVQTLIYIWGTPLVSFSLALLAAAGVHAVANGRVRVLASVAAGLAFIVYLAIAVRLNWQTLLAGGWRHATATLGLAVAVGALAWICAWPARRWPILSRPGQHSPSTGCSQRLSVAATAACGVVVAELFVLAPHDVYSDRYDSLAQPPYVSWLQQQASGQPFRVFSNDGLLYPNYAQAFGLDDPRVIDGQWPQRTWDFVQTFLSPSITDRYVGGFGHPELPTEILANKWLDFSNVRFILRPPDQSPSDATLAQTIVAANYPPNDDHHVSQFTIDGQRREVLVERTPGEISFHLRPNGAQPRLTFFVGLDPTAGTPSSAQFTVAIRGSGQRQILFDQSVDAHGSSGRAWTPGSVDLTPYLGQDIELILHTASLDDTVAIAGWGEMRLWPPPDARQFKQEYNSEVSIWENTHVSPRAFLVSNVQAAATPAEATARMQTEDFDPAISAVVEVDANTVANLSSRQASNEAAGTATIRQYRQQQVDVSVEVQHPALLVLTDSYYPGWTATLDAAPVSILATDLAFRGVLVPSGSHEVSFKYAPASFRIGLGVAAVASALLFVGAWRLRSEPVEAVF